MKQILTLLLFPCIAHSQLSTVFRAGFSTKEKMFASGALYMTARKLSLAPEFVLYPSRGAPVSAGVIACYNLERISFGAGRGFYLYSTDDYDKYRNGFKNTYFVQIYNKRHLFFLQIAHEHDWQISVGANL